MGDRVCCVCKRAEGTPIPGKPCPVELRPYGPGAAPVCFDCAMNPERIAETKRQFAGLLALAGPVAMLTDEGPAPAQQFIRDLAPSAGTAESKEDGA